MKNGKIFKGCMMLLALMLCLWTGGLCFAEGEAESGPEIECQMYESDTAEDEGSVISIEEYKKTEIDGKEFYQLKLYRQKYYLLKIKTNSSKNLTITMNNKEIEDQEENKDIFEKTVDEEGNQEIKLKVQHSEENKVGFWIYIDSQDETPVTIRFMIQWQDWEGSVQSTGQKTETTTGDSGEGTTESGTGDAPSTDVPNETSGVAAPVLPVETTPVDNTEPAGPAEKTFPAPTISLSGDKTLKRVSEDAMEWTISEDFETLLLTVEHITDDKGPIIVTCGDEKAGEETSTETTEEETKTAAQKKGKKAEVKEKEPIVIDLKDYVRKKVADQKDFHFVVDWTATTDESQKQNNQKAGDASAEIGTVNEDKTEFTLHVISKATVSILQESTEDKQDNDNEDNNQNTIVEILADNQKEDLEVAVSVNRDFGTVTILQLSENGEEVILASEEIEAEEDLAAMVVNDNSSDESPAQNQGLKNQFQEVVGKSQEGIGQAEGTAAEGADTTAEAVESAAEVAVEPVEATPTVPEEVTEASPKEPVSYEKNVPVEIVIEKGKISGDDAKLIARYENADGEEAKSAETIVYSRRWQEIRITEPAGIAYYYATDREKKVRISAEGEPEKQIVISLTHNGSGTMENGTYDQLTYGDIGSIANAATDEERSIRLSYDEDSEGKHSQPEVFEIRTDGEPEAGALVFRMCVPTIQGTIQRTIFDTTHPTIRIGDAVPGSALVLTMTEPAAQEPITAEIVAGEDGNAEYTREEPFAAGTKIALSEKDHPETVLAETEVVAGGLADIKPEAEKYEITGSTAKEAFSIRGKATPDRAMQAIFEDEKQTQVFSTQDFASDENGNWEVVFAENEKPKEDGIYRVTFIYTGRKDENQQNVNQMYVNVLIDTQCAFASENNKDGEISIQEGARELKFHTRELKFDTRDSDGFEEIRVDYLQEGMTNPMPIPASSQDESGEPLKAEKPDADGLITYKLPAQVRKNDRITVYLKDHRSNTEEVAVKILTLPFEHTLTEYSPDNPEGKKSDELQNLYVSETKELRIGISGAPGLQIAVECQKSGNDGEAKVLATLTDEKDETKEYTLNRDALETAFKGELTGPGDFTLSLHRIDIEGGETRRIAEFTYDTECPLTIKTIGDKEYKEDIQLIAGGWFSANNVKILGTSEPKAEIEYTVLKKNKGDTKSVPANSNGVFEFQVALASDSDTLVIKAKDEAGNTSEKVYEIRITPSSAGPIALMTIGVLLMAGFLVLFFNTQKKIRQLEEINRAKTATVQEKKKKR